MVSAPEYLCHNVPHSSWSSLDALELGRWTPVALEAVFFVSVMYPVAVTRQSLDDSIVGKSMLSRFDVHAIVRSIL